MEELPTEQVPTPDELARIIDGIIRQRLLIALSEDREHLKLRQEKLALSAQQRRQRWQAVKMWANLINSWTWAALLMSLMFSLGIYIGLNLLPEGVVCSSKQGFCYYLRFDGNKKVPGSPSP